MSGDGNIGRQRKDEHDAAATAHSVQEQWEVENERDLGFVATAYEALEVLAASQRRNRFRFATVQASSAYRAMMGLIKKLESST